MGYNLLQQRHFSGLFILAAFLMKSWIIQSTYPLKRQCFIRYIHCESHYCCLYRTEYLEKSLLLLHISPYRLSHFETVVYYQIGMHINVYNIFLYCFVAHNKLTRVTCEHVSSRRRSNSNWSRTRERMKMLSVHKTSS